MKMKHHAILSALPLAPLLALIGCGGETNAPAGPTYYQDAKPIIDQKCANCHYEGGIGPFALTTFEEVVKAKDSIKQAINDRTMPPWPASSSCADYAYDRSLSDDQLGTLNAWLDAKAPEGEPPGKGPSQDVEGLSRIDRTITMPVPYAPTQGPDDYRCFLVDWPDTELTYVTGVGVKPGQASIVHHVIAFLAKPENVAEYEQLDADEAGPGYTCFGGPGGTAGVQLGWIGAWAPGGIGQDYPPGTGIPIPPGSKVIMQVHYNTSTAPPVEDTTSIVLKLDSKVDKPAVIMPWADPAWVTDHKMPIPAHSKDTMHSFLLDPTLFFNFISDDLIPSNVPLTIHSAGLHMHTRGTSALTNIVRGDGDECALQINQWNFHWQGSYGFKTPKVFNPGDKLYLECHWDNTTDQELNWGEGTNDEMCLGVYYITE